jgi:uncharacterized protein (DUF885 family)
MPVTFVERSRTVNDAVEQDLARASAGRRDFDDVVLRDGVLPLELLREQVERYGQRAH